jgi:hypothetical protein
LGITQSQGGKGLTNSLPVKYDLLDQNNFDTLFKNASPGDANLLYMSALLFVNPIYLAGHDSSKHV